MIKKCPHCEFEPIQDQLICPNCGVELNDTILEKLENEETMQPVIEEMNDNIDWSNYEDVPLGSVMEHFNDTIEDDSNHKELEITAENDESVLEGTLSTVAEAEVTKEAETVDKESLFVEKTTTEDELSDNPILAAYIRRHREGLSEEELLAVIEENQSDEKGTPKVLDDELEESEVSTESKEKTTTEAQEEQIVAPTEEVVVLEKVAESIGETKELPDSQTNEEQATVESASEIDKALSLITKHEEKLVEENPTEQVISESVTQEVSEAPSEAQLPPVSVDEPTGEQPVATKSTKQVLLPSKKNRKKMVYTLTAVSLVIAASGGWMYYDNQQKAEAARQEQLRIESEITKAKAQLLDFYLTEDQTFIKPDKTLAQLKDQQKSLEKYRSEAAYAEIDPIMQDLYLKLTNIESLNSYFTAPILVGDQLVKEVHIKDESPIVIDNLSGDDAFAKLFNEALQLGKIELQKVTSAKLAVDDISNFYQDEQLSDNLTRQAFDAAKNQVDNLFEIATKETLQEKLAPIEAALIAREAREEAARIAAEQKAEADRIAEENRQAAMQQAQNVGSEILSPNTPTNGNNQPIIRSRQSDIDDVNNPAWAWAPGVYDRVVNTLISRGNIQAGAFYVVPVRIENGEGYYHLYATNKNTSGTDTYMVTINAKTGYFKGNGS